MSPTDVLRTPDLQTRASVLPRSAQWLFTICPRSRGQIVALAWHNVNMPLAWTDSDWLWLSPLLFSTLVHGVVSFGAWLAIRRRKEEPAERPVPRVSILKPLAGYDEGLEANLASFAQLQYPDYEVLLGVSSYEDPAYDAALRFVRCHPDAPVRLFLTREESAMNRKVAQLITLEEHATGTVVVISDSNVRADPHYLNALIDELSRPGVAACSSIVVGDGERSAGAALENLHLGGTVAPTVLTAWAWIGHAVTVGKTLAIRRSCLDALGGFSSVGDVLAEDYLLGDWLSGIGHIVTVSAIPVRNYNAECSMSRTLERHGRWAKIRRWIAPGAFACEPLLCPVVIGTLVMLLHPCRLAFFALLAAAGLQTLIAFGCIKMLRGRAPSWYWAPLEVVRSYLWFYCWASAWMSRSVTWRGHQFVLGRGSTITPVFMDGVPHVRGAAGI